MSAIPHSFSLLDAALSYASMGIAVFPCVPKNKNPLIGNGVHGASKDLDQVRAWWTRWPNANIGAACGAISGFDALDIDGEDGRHSIGDLIEENGLLPLTPTSLTARGEHRLFKHDPRMKNSAKKLGDGLDTRSDGGYILLSPSVHPDGPVYRWEIALGETPLATWPEWIVSRFVARPVEREPAPVMEIGRDWDHAKRYCAFALEAEVRELSEVGRGERNNRANVAAFKMGGYAATGAISKNEVRNALFAACRANGLVRDDGENAVLKTINSGLDSGYRHPRDIPEPRRQRTMASAPEAPEQPPIKAPSLAWRTIAELGGHWLDVQPPARVWLLLRDGVGALGRGIVGTLVAPGSRGKSTILAQLALAVAIADSWLNAFAVVPPGGRVLLLLAEEDLDEIRRKLYWASRSLTEEQRALAASRIVPLGLRGQSTALVQCDQRTGVVTRTALHAELIAHLKENEYALVILDPLSRMAPDAESDNAIATAAVEAIEALTQGPGNPTVIVAHHTSKGHRADGNKADGTAARGVTAIYDGVRFEMQLSGSTEADLALENTKNNYAPRAEKVLLVRGEYGVLRPPSSLDMDLRRVEAAAADADLRARILNALMSDPGLSGRELEKVIGGRSATLRVALERLQEEGAIVNRGGGGARSKAAWFVVPRAEEGADDLR